MTDKATSPEASSFGPVLVVAGGLATLFVELALIRYVPGQLMVLGYFTNFVLMAAFLGFGLGILASSRWPRLTWIPWCASCGPNGPK